MRTKRYYFLAICIFLLMASLIGRLVQLQLIQTESFSKHHINLISNSVEQRTQEIVIDDGRGQFLDRNGEPLTFQEKPVLILFPFLKQIQWDSKAVAQIIHVPESQLIQDVENAKEPFIFNPTSLSLTDEQITQINQLKIPGVFAIEKKNTTNKNIAGQLIGVTGEDADTFLKRYPDRKGLQNQKIGITGLQKQFDEFLIPEGESKLVYHVDAIGGPLFGIDVKYSGPGNPFYPVNIQTTINKDIQEKTEQLVDNYKIKKGGVILLDIETNEILANISRPYMDPTHPFANNAAKNMMLTQQIPGSVFKTVVASAAIESDAVSESDIFPCSEDLYGKRAERDLGELDFTESFAESCNRTFGDIAKRLKEKNPDLLEEYAQKLGLTGDIGWNGDVYHLKNFHQLNMDTGQVFSKEESKRDVNLVAQTGIGQQEVRVTPLGIANMMATIARGGEKNQVKAVSSIKYKDGTNMVRFPSQKLEGDTITPLTANKLQEMLRQVVTSDKGTGRWFQNLPYDVAGKSGTAETGIYSNKQQLHNKWFAGYFPYKNPKYALVVVNLEVPEDEGGINPLFADIVKMLSVYDKTSGNHD